MDNIEAITALKQADQLGARARRTGTWYARYLAIFAAASLVMAISFGLLGPRLGAIVITPLWVIFVIGLSVWATRQKSQPRGMVAIHLSVIGVWTLVWGVTLVLSFTMNQAMWWWIIGAVVMAIPPLVGRAAILRRIKQGSVAAGQVATDPSGSA